MSHQITCKGNSAEKNIVATISSHVVALEQDISDEMLRQTNDYFVPTKPCVFNETSGHF